ncbi:chymotrypsin-like protease CTRL-1 [Drosophila mauritiana]|uniref:Chymotrypsin-like protease CTRL-1 n=1 Tax=Drosophila mauritiana TaxID=7226 RepID=A0A6P8JRS1_DROMA|nr:chymotrypsin-like protease CTRL-1 [Drosophila mauritiana]
MYSELEIVAVFTSLLIFFSGSGTAQFLENICGERRDGLSPYAVGPWTAILHHSGRIVCVGTLIHERFILTDVHCGGSNGAIRARLGEYGRIGSELAEDHAVAAFFRNANFNPETQANNVGLMKLLRTVIYKEHIIPVCILLDSRMQTFADKLDYFNGTTWKNSDISPMLSSKTVVRMPQACGNLDKGQFCAGHKDLDTCDEPSGAALTREIDYILPNRTVLFGIANSVKENCSNSRSYTDMVQLHQWISTVIYSSSTNDGMDEPHNTTHLPELFCGPKLKTTNFATNSKK